MAFVSSSTWTTTYCTLAISSVLALGLVLRLALTPTKSKTSPKIISSPRDTLLPLLSPSQVSALPYPPNILPGAREVDSPYGVMRVYEWGPENGRKVVMVHGDTTPVPVLAPIAKALVKRGCRVIILDLWGRGYSDTPLDLPHDSRLFTMQILIAVTSSPLSWTGTASNGFSILGFSLGGGITMSFAAHFPSLVNSIILLAPGGILRSLPIDYETTFFRYPGLVPSTYLRRLVGKVLNVDRGSSQYPWAKAKSTFLNQTEVKTTGESKPLEAPAVDVPAVVQWQFDYHQGFIHSFVNTIQHGPLQHQHAEWKKVCESIKRGTPGSSLPCRIQNSKILVIFGDADAVVVGKEVSEDLGQMLGGAEHVEFHTVPGSHSFPVPSCEEVVKHISDFWKLESVKG